MKHRKVAGMTALVPPEVIYASGWSARDVNNGIPCSDCRPRSKLCAWTAGWREEIFAGNLRLDALVVVAGGDCHNALADGQNAARKVDRAHFLFYPFDGDVDYMRGQLDRLTKFLTKGSSPPKGQKKLMSQIEELKGMGRDVERARSEGRIDPALAFRTLISFSDFEGDVARFRDKVINVLDKRESGGRQEDDMKGLDRKPRVALIGVPPIYRDFHAVCAEAGLHAVFDELPHEFVRLGGSDIEELAKSYSTYTFARPVDYRLEALKKDLDRHDIDGIIHYTQFTCHHQLEDGMLREKLKWPMLTLQGDLPGETPAQIRMRLEAFAEMLGGNRPKKKVNG